MTDAQRRIVQDNRMRPFEAYSEDAFYMAILKQGSAVLKEIAEGASYQTPEVWVPNVVTAQPLITPYRSTVIMTANAFARYAEEDIIKGRKADSQHIETKQEDTGMGAQAVVVGISADDFVNSNIYQQIYRYISTYGVQRITSITDTNREMAIKIIQKIVAQAQAEGLSIPETQKLLKEMIPDEWRKAAKWHSERIARTEVLGASNQGELAQVQASGLPLKKYWIARLDGRERDAHRQAAITYSKDKAIGINEFFKVDGDMMNGPGDPRGQAGNVVNCRCVLGWVEG